MLYSQEKSQTSGDLNPSHIAIQESFASLIAKCYTFWQHLSSQLVWRGQTLGFDRVCFASALIKGLVCPAQHTRVKLRESCKTNQIAVLLISA